MYFATAWAPLISFLTGSHCGLEFDQPDAKEDNIIDSLHCLHCYVMICILLYGCSFVESYVAVLQHVRKRRDAFT